jgi:Na+/H+ antiporter NhaC
LIVGPTFRPLADRLQVSRAKLAFIVDSTAAPVAILVPFIGWGVYIMSLLEQQFQALGVDQSDFAALVAALPYQLYAWLAILLVPLLALAGVDVGPMRRHEALARANPSTAVPILHDRGAEGADPPFTLAVEAPDRARASFVWFPLLVLAAVLAWMLVPLGFPFGRVSGADFRAGLSTAYVAAALALIMLMALHGVRRVLDSVQLYLAGMGRMMQVAVMLILAWALGDLNHLLGADIYIAALAAEHVASWSLPVLIFLLSGVISFATGSSWGTFAIMFPLALPAALVTGADVSVCIGAVLSGGLFGDHSSPISETTILSATGAGSDPFEHFQTQLPYALANGMLCMLGFVAAGFSPQVWIIMVLLVVQIAVVLLVRRTWLPAQPSG